MTSCANDSLRILSTKTDEFVQNTAAMVDVLWVVDNSESMGEEQTGLGQSFDAFMGALVQSGVDYHVGVISTDEADGGVLHAGAGQPAYINKDTLDPQAAFIQNVRVGTGGARREQGFMMAATALGKGMGWTPGVPEPVATPNPGFLRRGFCNGTCEGTDVTCSSSAECTPAALFIIFVSDEDDKSFGPAKYYWRLFKSYLGPGNEARIKISAIAGPVPSPDDAEGGCFRSGRGSAQPGYRYAELLSQTSYGSPPERSITSICDDFTEALGELSITAAGLDSKFELGSTPNLQARIENCGGLMPEPFCVKVEGTAMPRDRNGRDGWDYEESTNSIVFGVNVLPRPQAKITVEYQEVTR